MSTPELRPPIRGRGAADNPANRFVPITIVEDGDTVSEGVLDEERPNPRTVYLRDASRTILSKNSSPDVGFEYSVNPYRGCEHGCVYCYARPTHEYLGFSSGLDFETKILVKEDAPDLLRKALASPRWKPQMIALSGVTDPYQPVERKLRLTRRCLEVLLDFRNPVGIVTKNYLVTRDIDLLREFAGMDAVRVYVSITSLRPELQRIMEPRTATPARRLDAVRALADAGVPVGVLVAPVVPGLTDEEIPAILQAVAEAGARDAAFIPIRLPHALKDLFGDWLERHFPDRREKVLNRIRELRGGALNDSRFGTRMRGEGVWADQIRSIFRLWKRRTGLDSGMPPLSTTAFRRPAASGQLGLFED